MKVVPERRTEIKRMRNERINSHQMKGMTNKKIIKKKMKARKKVNGKMLKMRRLVKKKWSMKKKVKQRKRNKVTRKRRRFLRYSTKTASHTKSWRRDANTIGELAKRGASNAKSSSLAGSVMMMPST
jgi:hypothetical protein